MNDKSGSSTFKTHFQKLQKLQRGGPRGSKKGNDKKGMTKEGERREGTRGRKRKP